MRDSTSKAIWANMVWLGLCCATSVGCGGGPATTQAGPLKDREAIASALPPGVTLASPVVPDPLYGSTSKNVEDALASLQAYVRNNVIYDGGIGREIRFQPEGAKENKTAGKSIKKSKARETVIVLSRSGG
jgi:hypothetical protein